MRNAAAHLDIELDVKDADLKAFLQEANAIVCPTGKGLSAGDKIDLAPVPWAWEGIIMRNRMNLLVAQPKVGKTAFILEMISKWYHGDGSFLDRKFHNECPSVIIVGTDQGEADWGQMLKAVDLLSDDGVILDPIKRLYTAGDPLYLTEDGLKTLEGELEQHENCFVLVDSYHTCVAPLAFDESGSNYANAMAMLHSVTSKFGATCCVIHHANKGAGTGVVSSTRGTTALTAIPSQLIHMAFAQEGEGKQDRRIKLKTHGRSGSPLNLLLERLEDGWESYGDGEALEAAERLEEASMELSGRQADMYDHILMRWELGQFPVSGSELGIELNLPGNKVGRFLKQLMHKGLIESCGTAESTGGRPSRLYKPCGNDDLPPPPGVGKSGNKVKSPEQPPLEKKANIYNIYNNNKNIYSSTTGSPALLGSTPSSTEDSGFSHPRIPVERLMPDGSWEPGWLIHDGSNRDAITIEKLGNPLLRIRNMRWEIDLRASTSAFKGSEVSTPSEASRSALRAPLDASDENPESVDSSDETPYGF